jgi:hypothetical protein
MTGDRRSSLTGHFLLPGYRVTGFPRIPESRFGALFLWSAVCPLPHFRVLTDNRIWPMTGNRRSSLTGQHIQRSSVNKNDRSQTLDLMLIFMSNLKDLANAFRRMREFGKFLKLPDNSMVKQIQKSCWGWIQTVQIWQSHYSRHYCRQKSNNIPVQLRYVRSGSTHTQVQRGYASAKVSQGRTEKYLTFLDMNNDKLLGNAKACWKAFIINPIQLTKSRTDWIFDWQYQKQIQSTATHAFPQSFISIIFTCVNQSTALFLSFFIFGCGLRPRFTKKGT